MRVVVAIGGNALLTRGERPDAVPQRHHVEAAAAALAPLAAQHQLVLCHGNGPQVGLLAVESSNDTGLLRPYPLDVLGAQTQGMIGYWLTQALGNLGVLPVVALVTQTVVAADDPAFAAPTKFIGAGCSREQARDLERSRGWTMRPDGDRWRRVVPSPEPLRLVEQATVDELLRGRTTVVCGGGGGAPVVEQADGTLRGVEAVVDKDLLAAVLAAAVGADRLLVLTDVAGVFADFGTPQAALLPQLSLGDLDRLRAPAGSMGPKLEACRRFVAATGGTATIGALTDAALLLDGAAGTTVSAHPTDTGGPTLAVR